MNIRLSTPLALMAAIYLLNVLGDRLFDVYGRFPWFDIPMHFAGGLAVGMLGISLQQRAMTPKQGRGLPGWYRGLFVIGVVMTVAVVWEWHEFVQDWLHYGRTDWTLMQPTSADTMKDLLMGFLGGLTAIGVFLRKE